MDSYNNHCFSRAGLFRLGSAGIAIRETAKDGKSDLSASKHSLEPLHDLVDVPVSLCTIFNCLALSTGFEHTDILGNSFENRIGQGCKDPFITLD